jgi:hypothetical protein
MLIMPYFLITRMITVCWNHQAMSHKAISILHYQGGQCLQLIIKLLLPDCTKSFDMKDAIGLCWTCVILKGTISLNVVSWIM